MKAKWLKGLIGWMGILCCANSLAMSGGSGVLLSLGFSKFDQETEGPQFGNSKTLSTYYDLKLGYLLGNDFYVGGIYSAYTQDNGVTQPKQSMYGVTGGYHHNGWFLDGSCFLDGQLDSGGIVFKKPSGLGIDFGYQAMMGQNFFVGAQWAYKSYTYKEHESSGVVTSEDNKVKSQSQPMLLLGLIF